METNSNYLKLIKEGFKRAEIRSRYKDLTGQYVGFKLPKDKRLQLIVKIGLVIDLQNLEEDEKQMIYDEAYIDERLRNSKDLKYCYVINEVILIN